VQCTYHIVEQHHISDNIAWAERSTTIFYFILRKKYHHI